MITDIKPIGVTAGVEIRLSAHKGRLDFDLVNEVIGDHKGIVFIKIGDTLQHFINDRDYINLESAVLLVNEHLQYLEDIMP